MAAVRGEELGRLQSLCSRNDRCVHEPELEIGVFPHQRFGSGNVFGLQRLDDELAVAYCANKCSLGVLRNSTMKQGADFLENTHRYHHRLAVLAPPFHNAVVPRVARIDQCEERAGIGDYGHAGGLRRSSLSTFSDVFFFPLENLPVTDGSLGGDAGSAR